MPAKPKTSKRPRVRVRSYRHGLGDCHLVTFKKPNGSPFHMLIDCGVVDLTPDPQTVMGNVARDIRKETGGTLDIVVATHAHTDHLSGFKQAGDVFKDIKFKRLWLSWMEESGNALARKLQRQLVKKLSAVREAAARLAGAAGTHAAAAARIRGVLDFIGPAADGSEMQAIVDALKEKALTTPDYWHPGNVIALPEVPNVRVYVLGPPKKKAELKVMDPRKSKHESYEVALAAAAEGFADALGGGDAELGQPFDSRYRRTVVQAKNDDFFKARYFAADTTRPESPEWRRIDMAWLEMAEQLALYLDDYINNTSLALAFEFIDTGDVLLFPGDAQIGSWLSWHQLEWSVKDKDGTKRTVKAGDLFARAVYYKASHHASHNGTLSGRGEDQTGLEQMTGGNLVCVVPVDHAMSKKKRWDRTLPWKPLLKRLEEQTHGRLIFTDKKKSPPDPADLTGLTPAGRKRFAKQVAVKPDWIDYSL